MHAHTPTTTTDNGFVHNGRFVFDDFFVTVIAATNTRSVLLGRFPALPQQPRALRLRGRQPVSPT